MSRLCQTKNENVNARCYCLCSQESCSDIAPLREAHRSRAMTEPESDPPATPVSVEEPPDTIPAMHETEPVSQVFPYRNGRSQVADKTEGKPSGQKWTIKQLNVEVVIVPEPNAAKIEEYRRVAQKVHKQLYNAKRDRIPEPIVKFARERLLPELKKELLHWAKSEGPRKKKKIVGLFIQQEEMIRQLRKQTDRLEKSINKGKLWAAELGCCLSELCEHDGTEPSQSHWQEALSTSRGKQREQPEAGEPSSAQGRSAHDQAASSAEPRQADNEREAAPADDEQRQHESEHDEEAPKEETSTADGGSATPGDGEPALGKSASEDGTTTIYLTKKHMIDVQAHKTEFVCVPPKMVRRPDPAPALDLQGAPQACRERLQGSCRTHTDEKKARQRRRY